MSSMITSLTPNQVNDELNKMQAFIKKEAEEKAKEIQLKADQEYEIEKTQLVRTETSNIDSAFSDKMKKASLKQQISKSTVANKMRLKILSSREESLDNIFELAKKQLKTLATDEPKYKPILKGLILEAMCKLLDSKIIIQATKRDESLVKSMIDELKNEYKTISKSEELPEITISEDYLNKDISGGAVVSNANGKISINNTLEERLELLNATALPAIRLEMFGPSESRKFFD
ncbi:hypothetical protein TBLA_0E01860 [Henningerozyma blattae CBS 6284]|uniref:V-type proton ATPase subunit E n=1 Tax=Henningerozyma blattae (strain ATCC 34711 / CBS 6284 / DSM 70876 / NBRC 10599 / NRRL Y-10934 / UCD 77-7) TaxID=1071380 RepID=I2H4D8_HENB6|nr:hypothetical protein TBLA_0E01860 [Tetrapisispora blattae CBS 6284]CCH61240.1 hypothetical protein TBLA_0E01860 [Tetrapisispora blattae CBS 6284]